MAKKEKGLGSIVSINRATQMAFELRGNELLTHNLRKSKSSREFYVSYIPFKDIMMTTVEIPRTISEDDIPNEIVIKVYGDLGLDTALDYKITYTESSAASGDNRLFNVFVVNSKILQNDYEPIANQTNYIDYIALAPFLPAALYKRGVIGPEDVECFIYLQEDDAFLVVYQNGEYFQSRQLRYNLKYIHDKFSELAGTRIDEREFFNALSKSGINFQNPVERDYIIQIFDDIFFYIGDIIAGLNKIYGINIKNTYFGSDIGQIPGIEAFIEDRLKLVYKDFNFSIATNQKSVENFTQIDVMMILTAQDYMLEQDDEFNYSPFRRPPPFWQRNAGKMLQFIAVGIILGLGYPAYQYGHGFYLKMEADKKKEEFDTLNQRYTNFKRQLEQLSQEYTKEEGETIPLYETFLNKRNVLDALYDKKVEYAMKSKGIYDLSGMVNELGAHIYRIYDKDKNLTISVRTKTDNKMTDLLKKISNKKDNYSVMTRSIVLDDNNQSVAYESNISVELKNTSVEMK